MIKIKIAIIDGDLVGKNTHRFPNLACMKLSAYHKDSQDDVILKLDYKNLDEFDKVYISKAFTESKTPDHVLEMDNVKYGGTGFFYEKAEPLPIEIEHLYPDYHLYDEWVNKQLANGEKRKNYSYYLDYSIGFTTRGCFRKCEFCVNKRYDRAFLNSPIEEFINSSRKNICLLDDNVLAYPGWKDIMFKLGQTGKRIQFKQGLDIRLLTEEKAEIISKLKYKDDFIFAFDHIDDREMMEEKLTIWNKYRTKATKLYVLVAYESQDEQDIINAFERVKILMKHKCKPYIMRYNEYENSKYRGVYINLARWCNQSNLIKKISFREFAQKIGEGSAAYRYMDDFEKEHPEIAKEYYDMKWEHFNP